MAEAARWKTAWITGASSGIGRELALLLAKRGVRVAVSARRADKLAELTALDEKITAYPVDVTDRAAMAETARRIGEALGPIDLAIFNAGVWHPMGSAEFNAEKNAESMAINYTGVVNGLAALMPDMVARGAGQIALISSVAGYRGFPRAAAYAPSKAAVTSLAEVLHPDLKPKGVHLSVVNPGFVETPMTSGNAFAMPWIIPPDDAARRIVRGLERRKFEIAFPWQLVLLLKFFRIMPYPVYFWAQRMYLDPAAPVKVK